MSRWTKFVIYDRLRKKPPEVNGAVNTIEKPTTRRKEIGQVRRERTRQKLLSSAARVLAEHGEAKATIDDFIQAAGLARGTFYNYYSTRKELLDDVWQQIGRDPLHAIQRSCAHLVDPAERLISQARLVLSRASDDPTWGWLVYALSADGELINKDLLSFPRPDLVAGLQTGRFQFADLDSANDIVVGSVRRALRATLGEPRAASYPITLSTLLLRALGLGQRDAERVSNQPLPPLNETRRVHHSGSSTSID